MTVSASVLVWFGRLKTEAPGTAERGEREERTRLETRAGMELAILFAFEN